MVAKDYNVYNDACDDNDVLQILREMKMELDKLKEEMVDTKDDLSRSKIEIEQLKKDKQDMLTRLKFCEWVIRMYDD